MTDNNVDFASNKMLKMMEFSIELLQQNGQNQSGQIAEHNRL